ARMTFRGRKETAEALARGELERAAGLAPGEQHLAAYRDGLLAKAEKYRAEAETWRLHEEAAATGFLLKMTNTPPAYDASIGALRDVYAEAHRMSRVKFLSRREALDIWPGPTVSGGTSWAGRGTNTGPAYGPPEGAPNYPNSPRLKGP